jgi:diguanylate cyclase (GGDEF)-like protein
VLLDFKTLSLMVVISSFLYAITIAFFALQANQYKGISLYMWGAMCAAGGFLLGVLVTIFPQFLVIRFGASSFLTLASYFYCLGIIRFLDFYFKIQYLVYILLSGITVIGYFIFFDSLNNIANIFAPFYAVIFYSIACYFLWQCRHKSFTSSIYFMLVNLIFIILLLLSRCYAVLVYHIQSSFENQAINNDFLLAIFISGYLRNVGFIIMVSQRLYQDLREAAARDFLTKIYNRRATQQILEQQFNQFERYHSFCSLILVDIDYFKAVNDNYGHETGDKVLQTVAIILKTNLRKTDTLGRWGGEEFLCILPNTRLEKAIEVAEKLRLEIAKETIEGIACTISLGVKMFDDNDHSSEEAIKRADQCLYTAKHKGRNCVVAFISSH